MTPDHNAIIALLWDQFTKRKSPAEIAAANLLLRIEHGKNPPTRSRP